MDNYQNEKIQRKVERALVSIVKENGWKVLRVVKDDETGLYRNIYVAR